METVQWIQITLLYSFQTAFNRFFSLGFVKGVFREDVHSEGEFSFSHLGCGRLTHHSIVHGTYLLGMLAHSVAQCMVHGTVCIVQRTKLLLYHSLVKTRKKRYLRYL